MWKKNSYIEMEFFLYVISSIANSGVIFVGFVGFGVLVGFTMDL